MGSWRRWWCDESCQTTSATMSLTMTTSRVQRSGRKTALKSIKRMNGNMSTQCEVPCQWQQGFAASVSPIALASCILLTGVRRLTTHMLLIGSSLSHAAAVLSTLFHSPQWD